jgi:integrase
MSALADSYLSHKKAEGLARRSLEAYQLSLEKVLLPFLRAHDLDYPDQLSEQMGRDLSIALQARGLARATVQTYLRQIQFFLDWLWKQGELRARLQLPRLRSERRIVKTLEPQQLLSLQAAAFSERDRLILQVLSETGLRAGELARLRIGDLEADPYRRHSLHVRGKGAKDRLVPISPALYRGLRRYVDHVRPLESDTDRLFVSLNRSRLSGRYEALQVDGLQGVVERAAKTAGINRRDFPKLGPHLIRKSFTRNTLRQGSVDSEAMRSMLGHSDTRMIREVYGQLEAIDSYDGFMESVREQFGR